MNKKIDGKSFSVENFEYTNVGGISVGNIKIRKRQI